MEPIIQWFTDNDLYTFTVGQAVFDNYDDVDVEYRFVDRSKDENRTKYPPGFAQKLWEHIKEMSQLRLQKEERNFLEDKCYYLHRGYIDWLSQYRFNPDEVQVTQHDGDLEIVITGPWYKTIFWEVPLLALVSELYFRETGQEPTGNWRQRAHEKGERLSAAGADFIDFGTRRRFSFDVHDQVIKQLVLSAPDHFKGTSNVRLSMMHNLTPHGTMSHQWIQAHAGLFGVRSANAQAMRTWADEFGGYLGIALTDTYTTQNFLHAFDARLARLFDGVRHDSGDEKAFVDMFVEHYNRLRIDPLTKRLVFSNALTVDRVININRYCQGLVKPSYGIGTHFMNDVGATPLNIVIKLFEVGRVGEPRTNVVKLSDDRGKETGDEAAILAAKYEIGLAA